MTLTAAAYCRDEVSRRGETDQSETVVSQPLIIKASQQACEAENNDSCSGVASLSAANDRRLASNSTADLVRILIGSRLALTTNFRRLWIWFDSYYRRALTRDHLPALVASHRRRLDKPTRCRPTTDGTHGGRNYLTRRGPTFGACYCTRPGKNASNCRRKHPSCVVED